MIDGSEAIKAIQGTAGMLAIQSLVEAKIKNLQDIENIDEHLVVPVEIQAMGRKYAKQLLTEFLTDISVLEQTTKTSNTYE